MTSISERFTLIVLVTTEEERALQAIKTVCQRMKRVCISWDVADHFQLLTGNDSIPSARDPLSALEQIEKAEGEGLYILKDFHECWSNPQIKRKLRNVVQRLKYASAVSSQ